jgi:hypothetical protein
MLTEKAEFFTTQQKMDYIPFTQSEGWHDYKIFLKRTECIYFVDSLSSPGICAWGLIRSFPLVGKILRISGESYKEDITRSQIKMFYDDIAEYSKRKFIFVLVSSQALYNIDYEMAIRLAGFVRPLALLESPLSIIVDLNNMKLSKSWRTRLKQARKNNLRFEYIFNPDSTHINHIVRMYAELSRIKPLGHSLDPGALRVLLKSNDFRLFFVYSQDDEPISAGIVYVKNDSSCGIIKANSKKSREMRGTSYLILDSVLNWLKDMGIKTYDMGRIGPGKRSGNSVYEFKSHIGSPEVSYNGEWIYSNNKILETLIYSFINITKSRY